MATYPVKMLKDEEGKPFVPLISIDSIKEVGGETLEQRLDKKLETTNIIAGTQIALEIEGNNVIISNSAEGTKLINNLDQTAVGVGALDAAQGKVLKESIPEVINNLTTIDSKKALSAHQGYVLAGRSVPVGGGTGQVLMKSADDDYSLTWGDAADPNAIVGDGSIKKIVELTYDEYIALEEAGQLEDTTEYHISDMNEQGGTYITETEIQDMINNTTQNYLPLTGGAITSKLDVPTINFTQGGMVLQKSGHGILRSIGNGSGTALQSLDVSSNIKSRLQFDPNLTLNYYYLDGDLDEDTAIWTRLPVGPIKMTEKSITTTQNGTADIEMSADDYIIISTYHPNTAINGLVFNYVYNNKYYIKACSYMDGFAGIGNTTFTIRIFYIDR